MATSPPAARVAAAGAARLLRVRVYAASHRAAPAVARLLTRDQAGAALAAYATARPRAWATLKPTLEKNLGAEVGDLPVVALDLGPAAAAQAA